mmetsp:Transcript_24133/g.63688  ORF Transcript_24133/g.63688 Transcript_24133/m.63688 type:complete len:486 (-) Transcript_24133:48-1505(-)
MLASTAAKYLPRDFVEVSKTGGFFTILAYVVMTLAFVMEVSSFFNAPYTTTLALDAKDSDSLQINFDVDMYDIECRNLRVAVFAQGGAEVNALSKDFWLRSVDQKGRTYGMATKPNEPAEAEEGEGVEDHEKTMKKLQAEDGKEELDADWANSHDGFKHKSFDHVIQAHDFTFINFFAGWCGHCQQFAPKWDAIAKSVHGDGDKPPMLFKDKDDVDRSVRFIRINCVDYQQLCREKGVDAYPMLRLYKADGTFSLFDGKRGEAEIIRWMERSIKMRAYGWVEHHDASERGCNAKGRIEVPRMPGHLELMAGGGDQNLNPRMTNVSHLIKHLSFSDPDDGKYHRQSWAGLPHDVLTHISPLDGRSFVTHGFHMTWIHDMKVVSTVSARGQTAYQLHHQRRLSRLPEDVVPQVQFHFDIEPFSIWVKREERKWYDFMTSLLAILGGSFVVMRLLSRASLMVVTSLKFVAGGGGGGNRVHGGLNINMD